MELLNTRIAKPSESRLRPLKPVLSNSEGPDRSPKRSNQIRSRLGIEPTDCDTAGMMIISGTVISLVLLIIVALAIGYAMNRTWIRGASSRPPVYRKFPLSRQAIGLPACGHCGYPARGISTLNCPECGADLREVGITTGRSHSLVGVGCILSIVFTIALVTVASILNPMIVNLFPVYEEQSFSMRLSPNSQAYGDAGLHVEANELIPKNSFNTGSSGASIWSQSGTGGRTTTVALGSGGGMRVVDRVAFSARLNPRSLHAWKEVFFEVDPKTLEATWMNRAGSPRSSSGVFSDNDVLAFLSDIGADTSKPDVQVEAKELHGVMTGLAQGMTQFTLTSIDSHGSSSSTHYLEAPEWFDPVYFFTWLVLWIVGLVFISRRGRKKEVT